MRQFGVQIYCHFMERGQIGSITSFGIMGKECMTIAYIIFMHWEVVSKDKKT